MPVLVRDPGCLHGRVTARPGWGVIDGREKVEYHGYVIFGSSVRFRIGQAQGILILRQSINQAPIPRDQE